MIFDVDDQSATFPVDEFEPGPCQFDLRAELALVDSVGDVVWRREVPWVPDWASQPIAVTDGAVVFSFFRRAGDGVAAVELTSGRPLWERTGVEAKVILPANDGVVVAGEPRVGRYDARSGAEEWTSQGPFAPLQVGSGLSDATDDALMSVALVDFDGKLVALDAADGRVMWDRQVGDTAWSVVLIDKAVGFVDGRTFQLVDAMSGESLGQSDLPGEYSNIVGAETDVVSFSVGPGLTLVEGRTGTALWTRLVGPGRDRVNGAVSHGDQVIVIFDSVGDADVVVASYDRATGDAVWETSLALDTSTKPIIANGELLVGGPSLDLSGTSGTSTEVPGLLVALDPDTGSTIWTQQFRDPPLAIMASSSGTIVANSDLSIGCD